jgi:hypothetical protein
MSGRRIPKWRARAAAQLRARRLIDIQILNFELRHAKALLCAKERVSFPQELAAGASVSERHHSFFFVQPEKKRRNFAGCPV